MTDQALVEKAFTMLDKSYVPYSHFPVGAALEGADGVIYTGCNVENAAYGSTLCAERTALVKAISEGCRSFTRLAVVGNKMCIRDRPRGSWARMASRTASEIWSQILSGCPSVTDSEVKKRWLIGVFLLIK